MQEEAISDKLRHRLYDQSLDIQMEQKQRIIAERSLELERIERSEDVKKFAVILDKSHSKCTAVLPANPQILDSIEESPRQRQRIKSDHSDMLEQQLIQENEVASRASTLVDLQASRFKAELD